MKSNFFGCARDEWYFSDMQMSIAITDLNSPQRAYIRPPYSPPSEITETSSLISPVQGENTPGYNQVDFQWEEVEGASAYFLEIDRFPTFAFVPTRFIVYGTSKTVEDIFDLDVTYYWRVKPFNNLHTCASTTNSSSFRTGTAVNTQDVVSFVNEWSVDPNPASNAGTLNIRIDSETSFEADVNLFSMNGQLAKSIGSRRFDAGNNLFQLSLNDLSSGVYLLSLQTAEGKMNKRIVITD